MAQTSSSDRYKTHTINLRIHPHMQETIDRAALAVGKTRSAFILDAAYRQAIDNFLDQRFFFFNEKEWNQLNDLLEEERPNPLLQKLMKTPDPW